MSYRKTNGYNIRLEREVDEIKETVEFSTMTNQMKEFCINKSKEALLSFGDGNLNSYKKLAKKIKLEIEAEKNETWNVVVGKEYGAYLAFEKAFLVYFKLNEIYFLIFRFGA